MLRRANPARPSDMTMNNFKMVPLPCRRKLTVRTQTYPHQYNIFSMQTKPPTIIVIITTCTNVRFNFTVVSKIATIIIKISAIIKLSISKLARLGKQGCFQREYFHLTNLSEKKKIKTPTYLLVDYQIKETIS